MELLELQQSKEAQALKLGNQVEELQIRLAASSSKLEEERLLYRQWRLASDNRVIKESIRPASTLGLVSTYEKEVGDLHSRLQQSRQDYMRMRRSAEEKVTQLEIRVNELVFKINEVNGLLHNESQEKDLMVKENKALKLLLSDVKVANEQRLKKAERLDDVSLNENRQKIRREPNSVQSQNQNNNHQQEKTPNETMVLRNENRELRRIVESREVQISHLEAAITEINSALVEYKARCQELESGFEEPDNGEVQMLRQRIEELGAQNSRLAE